MPIRSASQLADAFPQRNEKIHGSFAENVVHPPGPQSVRAGSDDGFLTGAEVAGIFRPRGPLSRGVQVHSCLGILEQYSHEWAGGIERF